MRVGRDSSRAVVLRNTGNDTLVITSVRFSGPFGAILPAVIPLFRLAPGAEDTVRVTFRPTVAGDTTGAMTVASNDPGRPERVVALRGRGFGGSVGPSIAAPTTLYFGWVSLGGPSNQTVTLWNVGSDTLVISHIRFSGPFGAVLPGVIPLFRLAPRDSAVVVVTFRPSAPGDVTGTMIVVSNDPGRPELTVSLKGRGISAPIVSIAPSALAFDSVRVGNVSRKTLTVSNTGSDTLRVWGVAVTGDSVHFAVSPPVFVVAPGGKQEVTVTFAPGAAGGRSATLSIAHNAAGGPSRISLTGIGVAPGSGLPSTGTEGTPHNGPSTPGGTTTGPGSGLPTPAGPDSGPLSPDFDGDREVGFGDFFLFASAFGQRATGENAKYDLDRDGEVGFGDFFVFASEFGKKR